MVYQIYLHIEHNMMMYKEYISLTAGHVLLLGALAVDLQTPTIYKTEKEEGESIHGLPETLADADIDWMLESRSRVATRCWSLELDLAIRGRTRGHGDQRKKKGTWTWRSKEEEGDLDLESHSRAAMEELRWRREGGVRAREDSLGRAKTPMPSLHQARIYAS
jgi:hypothetical protein